MIDEIPKFTAVKVDMGEGREQRVLVRTASSARAKLGIELSLENLQLLCCSPVPRTSEIADDEVPQINEEHVGWMQSRNCVYVRYYDKSSNTWKIKSYGVKRGPDFQERVDKMAKQCSEFFEQHHHVKDGGEHVDAAGS